MLFMRSTKPTQSTKSNFILVASALFISLSITLTSAAFFVKINSKIETLEQINLLETMKTYNIWKKYYSNVFLSPERDFSGYVPKKEVPLDRR